MIYEIEIYDAPPGGMAAAEKQLANDVARANGSKSLIAAWRTEIGPLNRFIHVHAFDGLEVRQAQVRERSGQPFEAVRKSLVAAPVTRLMAPLAFSPAPGSGQIGPYYEFRSYTYRPDDLPEIERAWAARIDERTKTSPLWAVWRSADDGISTLVHIWPYRSLDERAEIRSRVGGWSRAQTADGAPRGNYAFVRQETLIAVPTSYSPAR